MTTDAEFLANVRRGYEHVAADPSMVNGCALSFERDIVDPRMIIITARVPCPADVELMADTDGLVAYLAFCNLCTDIVRAMESATALEEERTNPENPQ